mmetsp:Transcript_30538/g.49411  ORF Transcript_30538/g.49411 Transcript_30538/m.49411 type:complete len:85 (-) Transcript_30538:406-660(-)
MGLRSSASTSMSDVGESQEPLVLTETREELNAVVVVDGTNAGPGAISNPNPDPEPDLNNDPDPDRANGAMVDDAGLHVARLTLT